MTAAPDFGFRTANYTQLADILGVSPNQVWTWAQRRTHSGFPEPIMWERWGRKKRPLFDVDEVLAWRQQYVPSKAPKTRRSQRGIPRLTLRKHGRESPILRAQRRIAPVTLPDGTQVERQPGWMPLGEIGRALGENRSTVGNWVRRRATNHFPEPVGTVPLLHGEGSRDLYNLPSVIAWRLSYEPQVGAPSGNRNARRSDQRERTD